MKKGLIAPLLIITSLLVGVSALIVFSNNAKPGDSLYTLDRTSEAFTLSLKKSVSKLAYGKYNLTLASERIQEMKALRQNLTSTGPLVRKVFAQSSELQTLNEYIALLLADISKNLAEAQATLNQLPDADREELSLEIADKTTEYGNDLLEIAKDLTTDNAKSLTELATDIEELDSSAVDFLANIDDDSQDTETETESMVSETLQDKLETKLLRYREELRIYTARMELNTPQLTAEVLQQASTLISEITTDLTMAESQLGEQAYKSVSDILDRTHDKLDKLKDLVKIETDEDASSESDSTNDDNDSTENSTSGDDSQDNENEDSEESEDEDDRPSSTPSVGASGTSTPLPTSTPRPSKTPEPSETPEPTEKPEPSEEPEVEEEEEVDGVKAQPYSNYSLLRNSLRF